MSQAQTERRATQTLVIRAVLAKHLEGAALEAAIKEVRDTMRSGPNSWAFKPGEPVPENALYEAGGNV